MPLPLPQDETRLIHALTTATKAQMAQINLQYAMPTSRHPSLPAPPRARPAESLEPAEHREARISFLVLLHRLHALLQLMCSRAHVPALAATGTCCATS